MNSNCAKFICLSMGTFSPPPPPLVASSSPSIAHGIGGNEMMRRRRQIDGSMKEFVGSSGSGDFGLNRQLIGQRLIWDRVTLFWNYFRLIPVNNHENEGGRLENDNVEKKMQIWPNGWAEKHG